MSFQLIKSVLLQARQSAGHLDVLQAAVRRCVSTSSLVLSDSGRVNALAESLASKGYLRAQKPYTPPADVRSQITALLASLELSQQTATAAAALAAADKFAVLNACFATFEHSVPNSHLHEVNSVEDIIRFYETPVNTTLPLDAMRTMDLPQNLHIQHEYVRFTGDTADKFGGQTAYPQSSTLVTGLKYRKKYQGYTAKRSWP